MPGSLAVCVGITVLDVVQRVAQRPRWGVKSVATSVEIAAGGPAANAAVTAARLLGSARLITAVGDSPQAELVRADLARHGVEVIDCAPTGWSMPVSTCIVEDAGERTVVAVGATDSPVELSDPARALVRQASGILVDGHHPRAALEALELRDEGCVAVLDAGSAKPHVEGWLPLIDVAAGSADYAAGLGLDLAGALAHVLSAGAGAGVMTDGANPLCWAQGDPGPQSPGGSGEPGRQPTWLTPPAVTAVDTLGAGDAFHGGLLAALVAGLPLEAAVGLAAQVASTRVAQIGARGWLSALTPLVPG